MEKLIEMRERGFVGNVFYYVSCFIIVFVIFMFLWVIVFFLEEGNNIMIILRINGI